MTPQPITFLVQDHHDTAARGRLTVLGSTGIPVPVRRAFWIQGVQPGAVRGDHAHRKTTQVVTMLRGSACVEVRTAQGSRSWIMTERDHAVVVPPMHWLVLTGFTHGALMMVLASEPYDAADYIRDFAEFTRLSQETTQ